MSALGQAVVIDIDVFSDAARTVRADPDGITLDIQLPDQTVTTVAWPAGAIVRDSLGLFHYTYLPPAEGHYRYHGQTTGIVTAFDGSFDVDPKYGVWLSLDDVKAELNIDADDTSQDVELTGVIDRAVEVIGNIVGPVTPTVYSEWHDGGQATVLLDRYPVTAVTTVSEYTPTVQALAAEPLDTTATFTGYGYTVDLATGVLTRTSGGLPYRFCGRVLVLYTAGRTAVPASIRGAALELVRHLWETQRGDGPGLPDAGYDGPEPGAEASPDYLVPLRVAELLAPYRKAPKVA